MKRGAAVLKSVPSPTESNERIPLYFADMPEYEELEGPFREIVSNRKMTNFGKYNTEFERAASAYLGGAHCATVSSGTMGLLFSLQALGVAPGQKVLLPSFTFMATAQAIVYAGAVPVFCEILPDGTIDPKDVEKRLSADKQITVVIGVHCYGLPARVDEVQTVVDKVNKAQGRKVRTLYDAAHAFGSAIGKRKVGTFGDVEVFSLSATKALVSVEGGLITTRDVDLMERIKKMRNYGILEKYNAHFPGMNGKMSEFHAVVGWLNMKNLEKVIAERQRKAELYRERVEKQTPFKIVFAPKGVQHTYKDFTMMVPPEWKAKRDALCQFLADRGVENRAYFFPPVHEQEAFKKFVDRPLPLTEDFSRRVITLPFFTSISETQMDRVAAVLKDAVAKLGRG